MNVHEWVLGDGAIEPKCEHEAITENKDWLEPASNAHAALTRVMLDVRFLRNLCHFVNFRYALSSYNTYMYRKILFMHKTNFQPVSPW